MCRNEAHKVLLEQGLYDWMFQMSSTDEEATFFISRAQLIKQYGLEPDEEVHPPLPTPLPKGKAKGKARGKAVAAPSQVAQEDNNNEEEAAAEEEEDDDEEDEEEIGDLARFGFSDVGLAERQAEGEEIGGDPEQPKGKKRARVDAEAKSKGRAKVGLR